MTSGGHAHSGRTPDPNALRRERPSDPDWLILEREHDVPVPAWPLTRATARELDLWLDEWRRPQAVMWSRHGWVREVALYVRALAVAEQRSAPVNSRTLVRQFMESLGISGDGLRRNRWRIREPGASHSRATGTEGRTHAPRWRPEVIDGGS